MQQSATPTPSYKFNFSSLYNPGESIIHPECRVYINSDTSALCFYKIKTSELKQTITDATSGQAKLQIKYVLRNYTSFEVVDSNSMVASINIKENGEYINGYFNLHIPSKDNFKLIISMSGQRENSGKRLIAEITNSSSMSADRFLPQVLDKNGWSVLYKNYVRENEKYRITGSSVGNVTVSFNYYEFSDFVFIPPYYLSNNVSDTRLPDSVFTYKTGDTICFNRRGLYVMKPSKSNPSAMAFINAGKSFPQIGVLSEMLEPLKLITTNKEYNELIESENLKLAIDNFWLKKSNNQKFAKEQIRVFYNRVELANEFFSDDKEGWKTDRGSIYVLLGPPSVINMSATGEEWYYGENPDIAGILFIFDKVNNPDCGYSYNLRRDANYQSVWAQALSTWKNGRIFTITNN